MATKPEFPSGKDMGDVTPEDVAEAKRRAKETEAYNKAMTSTEAAPAPRAPASAAKKMAKGGSASSRADGIAVRGKTRGKMC